MIITIMQNAKIARNSDSRKNGFDVIIEYKRIANLPKNRLHQSLDMILLRRVRLSIPCSVFAFLHAILEIIGVSFSKTLRHTKKCRRSTKNLSLLVFRAK